MGLFNRIKTSFRALFPRRYAWPGLDISLPGGQHLHLVGSIHMGTQGMSPLPPGLIKRLKRADALVVEADISGHESPFAGLESDRPLAERLNEAQLAELTRVAEETGVSLSMIDTLPGGCALVDEGMVQQQGRGRDIRRNRTGTGHTVHPRQHRKGRMAGSLLSQADGGLPPGHRTDERTIIDEQDKYMIHNGRNQA
jgi:hypothetical protein